MRIKLTRDYLENGQVKTTVRPKRKQITGWFEGTEIEVSKATGEKFIDAGDAIEVVATNEQETE